jgi:hypothetical protein
MLDVADGSAAEPDRHFAGVATPLASPAVEVGWPIRVEGNFEKMKRKNRGKAVFRIS